MADYIIDPKYNCEGKKCGKCRNCMINNIHPDMPAIPADRVVVPFPRDKWVTDRKPPFNTMVLLQTVENIVFFGFRNEEGEYQGVAVTKDNLYVVDVKPERVVAVFYPSDPVPSNYDPSLDKPEITKVTMTEGIDVDPTLKNNIEDIQDAN